MSVVAKSSYEEGCSCSSCFNSSNVEVDNFLEDNLNLDVVQGYQFQPRQSSGSDYGDVDKLVNAEPSSVAQLDNLDR